MTLYTVANNYNIDMNIHYTSNILEMTYLRVNAIDEIYSWYGIVLFINRNTLYLFYS